MTDPLHKTTDRRLMLVMAKGAAEGLLWAMSVALILWSLLA